MGEKHRILEFRHTKNEKQRQKKKKKNGTRIDLSSEKFKQCQWYYHFICVNFILVMFGTLLALKWGMFSFFHFSIFHSFELSTKCKTQTFDHVWTNQSITWLEANIKNRMNGKFNPKQAMKCDEWDTIIKKQQQQHQHRTDMRYDMNWNMKYHSSYLVQINKCEANAKMEGRFGIL